MADQPRTSRLWLGRSPVLLGSAATHGPVHASRAVPRRLDPGTANMFDTGRYVGTKRALTGCRRSQATLQAGDAGPASSLQAEDRLDRSWHCPPVSGGYSAKAGPVTRRHVQRGGVDGASILRLIRS